MSAILKLFGEITRVSLVPSPLASHSSYRTSFGHLCGSIVKEPSDRSLLTAFWLWEALFPVQKRSRQIAFWDRESWSLGATRNREGRSQNQTTSSRARTPSGGHSWVTTCALSTTTVARSGLAN